MRLPTSLSLLLAGSLVVVASAQEAFLSNALGQALLSSALYSAALARFSQQDFERAGYLDWVRRRVVQINQHAASHQSTLQALLAQAPSSPAPQACTYAFTFSSPEVFLRSASALEQLSSSAYLGSLPSLASAPALQQTAASLMLNTARQSAWLDSAVLRGAAWSGPAEPSLPSGLEWAALWSWVAGEGFVESCPSQQQQAADQALSGTAAFGPLAVQGEGGAGPVVQVEPGQEITLTSSSNNTSQSNTNTSFLLYSSLPPRLLALSFTSSLTLPSDIQGSAFGFLTTASVLPSDESGQQLSKTDLTAGPVVLSFGLASGAVSSSV